MATGIVIADHAVDAICLGSGRFLRSVLVPFLSSNLKPAIFQTRGRTFLDSFKEHQHGDVTDDGNTAVPPLLYPVDTIHFDGTTTTSDIHIYAAGTLGTPDGKSQLMDNLLSKMTCIDVIGVGVTESGLQSADNQCMIDLTDLLYKVFCQKKLECANPNGRVCVINTDNVPNNGFVIRGHVLSNARKYDYEKGKEFMNYLQTKVAFLNSMVDRITSSRPNSNGLVPLCEPLPNKALVVCDEGKDLPSWMSDKDVQSRFGVKIRHEPKDLESDIALKLRVANGTHTAVAHAMALLSLVNTEALCDSSPTSGVILNYLDSLYKSQILPAAVNDGISAEETNATWDDWRQRLRHPHFGLSTFFITQNGAAKCGIRLGPTIKSLIAGSGGNAASENPLTVAMAFAVAVILRFLTPASSARKGMPDLSQRNDEAKKRGVYVGWLDEKEKADDNSPTKSSSVDTVTYADGLRYNLNEGWYEFRCACPIRWSGVASSNDAKQAEQEINLPDALYKCCSRKQETCTYEEVIRSYLLNPEGGNLGALFGGNDKEDELAGAMQLDVFVCAVSSLYTRMVRGDSITVLLQEMMESKNKYTNGFASSCATI